MTLRSNVGRESPSDPWHKSESTLHTHTPGVQKDNMSRPHPTDNRLQVIKWSDGKGSNKPISPVLKQTDTNNPKAQITEEVEV